MNDILLFFVYKYEGDSKKILSAIERKEQVDLIELQEIKEIIKDKYITLLDKNYPKEFMNVIDPPFIIFYRGDISLLNKKSLAFIYILCSFINAFVSLSSFISDSVIEE